MADKLLALAYERGALLAHLVKKLPQHWAFLRWTSSRLFGHIGLCILVTLSSDQKASQAQSARMARET